MSVVSVRSIFVSLCLHLVQFASAPVLFADDVLEKDPRYLLIHLCGVSSHHLISGMESGDLPNLEKTFRPHGVIERAVTYLPSKTPTVISSLRSAIPVEEASLVSWARRDRESEEVVSGRDAVKGMMRSKARLANNHLLYGIPVVDRLAWMALANLPEFFEQYRVLEFYWFAVDTYGHFYGEQAYVRKLGRFDRQFGKLMQHLDEDVNIILYSDHGMTFGEGVETHSEIAEAIGGAAAAISYPNIYLDDNSEIDRLARNLVEETSIDFTFYKSGENRVSGYHERGEFQIRAEEGGLRFTAAGGDPFGYGELGYNGEVLTYQQWLELTHRADYPGAPVSIYRLLLNPNAADILTFLDVNKYSKTRYSSKGNHGGINYQDHAVPLLVRGPELELLYDRETLWMQDLFLEVAGVPFGHTPSRDAHYVNWWHPFNGDRSLLQLSVSPGYRWGLGVEMSLPASGTSTTNFRQAWAKFDVARSYLSRLWVGAGVHRRDRVAAETGGERQVVPMAFVRHEFRFRRLNARSTLSTAGNHSFALEMRLLPFLSIQTVNFNSAGVRLLL